MEVTVLYYSANVEDKAFENRIRENILRNIGSLSLVSVTQKAIDFGKNICVGKHENSYFNEFRQIEIGLKHIQTPYILTTEADVLLPPRYFTYQPKEYNRCYRYDNVWVHYMGRDTFEYKGYSDGCQLIDRAMFLKRIQERMRGKKEWDDVYTRIQFNTNNKYTWSGEPAITFKTDKNINKKTYVINKEPVKELPYWGSILNIKNNYL